MQLHRLGKSLFGKAALASAALSGLLFFAGAPGAQAADRDNDHRRSVIRVAHAEHELGEAIEDHGYYSRQADHWRHERHEAYDERGYYRDENGHRNQNGYYRDR